LKDRGDVQGVNSPESFLHSKVNASDPVMSSEPVNSNIARLEDVLPSGEFVISVSGGFESTNVSSLSVREAQSGSSGKSVKVSPSLSTPGD
jgi:hypothetical protein